MKKAGGEKSKTKKQPQSATATAGEVGGGSSKDKDQEEEKAKIGSRKRTLPVFPKPAVARMIPTQDASVVAADVNGKGEVSASSCSLDPNVKAALRLVLEDSTEFDASETESTRAAAATAQDTEEGAELPTAKASESCGNSSKTGRTGKKIAFLPSEGGGGLDADAEAKAAAKADIKAAARMEAMAIAKREAKAAAKMAAAAESKSQNGMMMMDNSSSLSYSTRRQRLAWALASNNSSNGDLDFEVDLEAGEGGGLVPMPPSSPRNSLMSKGGGGGGSGRFGNDCSGSGNYCCQISASMMRAGSSGRSGTTDCSTNRCCQISASMPGAVRVRGIDSTDDDNDDDDSEDDSEFVDIDDISEMFDVPPLELQRNDPRSSIPQSRPGAFRSPPGCILSSDLSFSHRSNLTIVTDPTGSSMFSLLDPLKASLVKQSRGGLSRSEHEQMAKAIEEALEVKPFSGNNQDEDKKKNPNKDDTESGRCVGSRFYGLLRVLCFLWVVGFVVGLLFQPDSTKNNSNDAGSKHGFKPRIPRTNPHASSSSSDSTDDTSSSSSTTISIFYLPFNESLLRPAATKLIKEDPESPHYKANRWVLRDPSLHDYPDWRKLQRFALATQFFASDGENWIRADHWLSYNVSECFWYGIGKHSDDHNYTNSGNRSQTSESCDKEGRIIVQNLSDNNLVGRTPKSAQLPTLQRVDKSSNSLSGRLPYISSIVEELVFSYNNFEGPLVVDGGITSSQNNLRILKLNGNRFTGFIHKGFSLFSKLQILNLTDNQFEGTVPLEVQHLPNLTYFGLGNNQYFGTIPTHFGLLSQLQELDLSGNKDIHGTIPSELGSLQSLKRLNIGETAITGDFPEELCAKQAQGVLELVANCSLVRCCHHS